MHLSRFPRVHLAHLPTPLEPMKRLSGELGIELWIKRDDCTEMSTGGNKTRKLEFLMGEAVEQGADMVMTLPSTTPTAGSICKGNVAVARTSKSDLTREQAPPTGAALTTREVSV